MKYISTVKDLNTALRNFLNNAKCGDTLEIVIDTSNEYLLTHIPKYTLSYQLSLIDIRRDGNYYVAIIIKRFGKGCRE